MYANLKNGILKIEKEREPGAVFTTYADICEEHANGSGYCLSAFVPDYQVEIITVLND